MTLATITVASHHFVINRVSARMRAAVNEFSRTLIQYSLQKVGRGRTFKNMPFKVFAASTASKTEFRYHINHLEAFKRVLYRHHIDDHLLEWKKVPDYEAAPINLVMQPHLSDREHQVPAIAYGVQPEPVSKMIVMQMGKGKTYTAMRIGSELKERICVMLRPKYIDQWIRDFKQNCVIDPKRICVVQGGRALKDLLVMAENGYVPYDVIIVSSDTFRGYIDAYEQYELLLEEEGYCVPPHQFFAHIKAGLRLIDEGHENFHFNFKLDLYTNVHSSVTLSATPFSDNEFINNMMKVAYPKADRYDTGEFDKYVTAYSLHYSVRKPSEIRTQGGQGYSHHELEKSLMKHPNKVDAYFKMVQDSMKYTYDLDYRPGDKCLIYFASIEMCTLFTQYIQEVYPHLDVRRFVEDDPYENLLQADISVSTLQSAGTGKDIPGLTTVILTVNVNSSPSNLQGFGRLRDLNVKDPSLGRKMFFVYFVGDDFEKHIEYHMNKKELLRTRALHYEKRFYGTMI